MDGPRFEQAIALPAIALRPFVAEYAGYRIEGYEPGIHAGLPSHYLTFIVSLGAPVELSEMPDPSQRPQAFGAFVGGLHSSPATVRHDGNQHGVQLRVTPLGARALFGMPAGELVSTVVDLGSVLGPRGEELTDRLRDVASWPARFAVLDDALLRWVCEPKPPQPEVAFTWRRLVDTGGALEVGTVAREVEWSRRHLSERFRLEYGLAPKVIAQVVRFERARRLLASRSRPSLAHVAAVCGYADQSHLTRDWRRFAGKSPTAWLTEELPFVQDDAAEPASQ